MLVLNVQYAVEGFLTLGNLSLIFSQLCLNQEESNITLF